MAEEPKTVCGWLDLDLNRLSPDDKVNLIREIADKLTTQQLRTARETINQIRLAKINEAKAQVIEEMRESLCNWI